MKKKRKVKNKLAEKLAEQEVLDRLLRAMERGRCIHELEGLLKDMELIKSLDPDFTDDERSFSIMVGVKWSISWLKDKRLGVDNE